MTVQSASLDFVVTAIEIPTNAEMGVRLEPNADSFALQTIYGLGASVSGQPVSEHPVAKAGGHWRGFGFLDYFNHIHFSALNFELGNLVSEQVRSLRVFNAYFVPQELNAVTPANDEGLSLTQPGTAPLMYQPFAELTYEISIGAVGPPTIDATYTFDFDVVDVVVSVHGARLVGWSWLANWERPIEEELAWLTDVMSSSDDHEQRRKLRTWPRQAWIFAADFSAQQRRAFENKLHGWGGRNWALPIWVDGEFLGATLDAGAESIPCTPATRDYHESGLAMLVAAEGGDYEAVEVASMTSGSIALERPTRRSWPAGTRIYPARSATLANPSGIRRFTGDHAYGSFRFRCDEPIEKATTSETLYRSYPVNELRPEWSEDPSRDCRRTISILDSAVGRPIITDESGLAQPVQSMRIVFADRVGAAQLRAWLYARAGRAKAVWLPTYAADLLVTSAIGSASTHIDVENCSLTEFAPADVNRRDLRIELQSGSILYRRVTSIMEVDENTERLTIDDDLGIAVAPTDIALISWMSLARLDSDEVHISWHFSDYGETSLTLRSPRNDV